MEAGLPRPASRLAGGVDFEFPQGTTLGGGDYLLVAANPLVLETETGVAAFGPFKGQLSNSGETIRLMSNGNRIMDEIKYRDDGDWPVAADGSGESLAKLDPDTGTRQSENWSFSAQVGGTPRAVNFAAEETIAPPSTSGLLAFYPFDSGPNDTSGNAQDGTLSGSVSLTTGGGGFEGEAYDFASGSILAPVNIDPAVQPQVTIGAWVNAEQIGAAARHEIISSDNGGFDRAITIDSRSGTGETGVARYGAFGGQTTGLVAGPTASVADGWTFVAAVFDATAGTTQLYVDETVTSGEATHGASGSSIRIGAHPLNIEKFDGLIDNVFIFSGALTPSQIGQIRSGGAAAILALDSGAAGNPGSPGDPTAPIVRPALAFSEISAAGDAVFQIELVNQGDDTVDLENLVLASSTADGGEFTFPAQSLSPGGFLVVAKDSAAFALKYPGVAVAGDYSGRLSNREGLIALVDPAGNPADEVYYYDDGLWPEFADGGGSSLELRDPDADNSQPGAWAASDESLRSDWQTYTYRGTAVDDGIGNNVFNELVIGMLDAGEILLDDVSVIKDPSGAATQLMQNGAFEADALGRNSDPNAGLNIKFNPDQLFRGVHETISIERASDKKELLAKHMNNVAGGGLASLYDDVAFIITPRSGDTGVALLAMARYNDVYLNSQYKNGSDGTVYNQELLYSPFSTVDGTPEGLKINSLYTHTHGRFDISDLGDDKEAYRWNFQLRNNRSKDDFSLMIALGKAFELSGDALDGATQRLMDVDQWMRTFAMASLDGNNDFYTRTWEHNFRMYQRPEDNKMLAMPWDLDRSFRLSTSAPLWGTQNLQKVIELPANRRLFYGHLLDIINTTANVEYMSQWTQSYGALIGQNFSDILT